MNRTFAALLGLVVLLAYSSAPAISRATDTAAPDRVVSIDIQEEGQGEDEGNQAATERRDGLDSVVIWSIVGLGIFALVLGAFYFFKRQVGGFPENPSWVAPITIMPSSDFPDEGDYGGVPSSQAHADH